MKLSEFELDVMEVFWASETELSAADIYDVIGKERNVVQNTVKTIIDRLEEKGAIERLDRKQGRFLLFKPTVTRESLGEYSIPDLLERFFFGKPSELFSHLLSNKKIPAKEIKRMKQILAEHEKTKK